MNALLVEPNAEPRLIRLSGSFSERQRIVRGPVDVVDPFDDDVIFILNDEGKNWGLPENRRITADLVIHGPFLVCGRDKEGRTISLKDNYLFKYKRMFALEENPMN